MSKLMGMQAVERTPTLSRQAYLRIQQAIRDGILQPGIMYSENEIAVSLGMSRTPVREAVIALNREGIIEISAQRGFHLRTLSARERGEIFDLRALLEPYVAGRLATTRTADQVQQLNALIDAQEKLCDPGTTPDFLALDEQFHLVQADFLDLEQTRSTMANLRGAMWLIGFEALRLPDRHADVIAEHRAIVDAIARGDSVSAEEAARTHILRTAEAAGPLE